VLYRDGDYVGSSVNVAARIADAAGPHQVFVSEAVRLQVGRTLEFDLVPRGANRLRGIPEPMELFEVKQRGEVAPVRLTDPVCRMEMWPGEVAVRLSVLGQEQAFCSQECLRKFVANPAVYLL
jgi:YHS domain-containing protein